MLVLVNPSAGGGTGGRKWAGIEPRVRRLLGPAQIVVLDDPQRVRALVQARLRAGETRFVAAGGDGTVNLVGAALVACRSEVDLRRVHLGAIGLGSSNDFHKPVGGRHRLDGVPLRLDFERSEPHDVGFVTYRDQDGRVGRRPWLINSSIGITAEANGFFNRPDAMLRFLKERLPGLAILYAAIHTILRNRTRPLLIRVDGGTLGSRRIANLGVVKNPHFAGSFRYDSPHEPGSGRFHVHALSESSIPRLLLALGRLARGRFAGQPGATTRRGSRLLVRSETPFALEGDGEVVFATEASFCLLPRLLRICGRGARTPAPEVALRSPPRPTAVDPTGSTAGVRGVETRRSAARAREVEWIDRLVAALPRSPEQLNGPHESDAELVPLPGGDRLLALTTDTISEEIESGLYADPYTIGWMAVAVSASDLAAVGADPLGLLVAETLPGEVDEAFESALQTGIAEACRAADLVVLGGDTNRSDRLYVTTTAVGTVPRGELLTRRGARPGDALFASGPLGTGGAYALARFADQSSGSAGPLPSPAQFRPRARLGEGRLLRGFGSACMDSSDGALAVLDELMRLNGVGFEIADEAEATLEASARAVARGARIPGWMLLAGPHGEYELIFTIPETRVPSFLDAAHATGWHPLRLGRCVEEPALKLPIDGRCRSLDTTAVRDLFNRVGGDPAAYLAALRSFHAGLTDPSESADLEAAGRDPAASPHRRAS